jgi:hypothetical protein
MGFVFIRFLERLSGEGLTDYVAWPLRVTLGERHLVSFSSSQPDGFADNDLRRLAELLPALSSVMERLMIFWTLTSARTPAKPFSLALYIGVADLPWKPPSSSWTFAGSPWSQTYGRAMMSSRC